MKTSLYLNSKFFALGCGLLVMLFFANKAFAQKEAEKIKNYLQANAAKHHLSGNDIQEMTISSQYLSPTTGWYHIYYNQMYQSIEVYNGVLNATLVNGKVEYVGSSFIENIAAKVPSGTTGLLQSPLSALSKAATHLGLNHNSVDTKEEIVTRLSNGQVSKAVYINNTLSDEPVLVKLYWFLHTSTENKTVTHSVHLAWNVEISSKDHRDYWFTQVDAISGNVLNVDNQVLKCDFGTPPQTIPQQNHLQSTVSDAPLVPASKLTVLPPNSYNVFDYPIESPNHGSRTIVTNPYTKFAPLGTGPGATNGWQEDSTTSYTTTKGNNVEAKEDIANDNERTIGASPTSATREFDYPYVFGDSLGNTNAAITNLFYWNNMVHDVLWKYGFDEPSGNYQANNMGRGGLGNDYILADAQDGLGKNNAFFYPSIDGTKGRMEMQLWKNGADGDFDNGIMSHEYGHGWSTRLTGGPNISGCLTGVEQAGEGWSDYLALMLTTKWSTLTPSMTSANIGRGIGTYAISQPNSGTGLRGFYYSYAKDSLNSAVTYARVANYGIPHGIGSIWATMLWDMTWEIILQDNQIVNNIYNTTNMVGNVAALKLVNEGLRLQNCKPSFVDARNAILKADSLLFNSRYSCAIWKAFARRGLGKNASTGVTMNDRIVIEDFTPVTNNGWVLSSPTQAKVCSRSVFNYTATVTGSGTPTFSWARAAVAGISNAPNSGKTATISETLINTTNSPITVTYKFYLTPSSCQVPFDVKVVVNPLPLLSVDSYEVCKDATVPVGEGLVATNPFYTNILNGEVVAGPTYWRSRGDRVTTYTAAQVGIGDNTYYQTHIFTPATSGVVSIEVVAGTFNFGFPYDTYLSLYQTSFNPASPATNFVAGDDDSGTLQYSSKITYNFVAGTTYILVITPYYNGSTGTYRLQATASSAPTSNIFGGSNNWYTNNSGGSSLATGNIFNPVGVSGSGIANSGTPLTKTFYLGTSLFSCRTPATFTINPTSVGGNIAGSATICNDLNKGVFTLSDYTGSILRWESSTDNFTNATQIADTTATITYTDLTQTTQYRVVVKNRACPAVNSALATITRTNITLPMASNFTICQGSSVPTGLGLVAFATSSTNTVSGELSAGSATYARANRENAAIYISITTANNVYYRAHLFVAPISGSVSIETIGGTLSGGLPYDTYLSLYQTSFNPAFPAVNFLVGDNNSGTLPYASKLTYTLTAGTTYILVVSTNANGVTGNYDLQATANIFGNNTVNWYEYSAGGTSLATGNIFKPIGVANAGIPDSNTPITKTFFTDYPDYPACRVPAVFAITLFTNSAVGGSIAGSATFCSDNNSGTLTLSGQVGSIIQWEYSTDNFATLTAISGANNTITYTNISQTTQYRALIQNGNLCDAVYSPKAVIIRTNNSETATDYATCQNATVPVGQGLIRVNPEYTHTVNGGFVAGSPTYRHSFNSNKRIYLPGNGRIGDTYYQTHTFTPTTSGVVTIEVTAATLTGRLSADTYIALYRNSFEPGSPATNYYNGVDDGSTTLPYASKLTDTLMAGTTYVLVVSPYLNDQTGTYEIHATADIFGNPTNWYTDSSGGTALSTGNIFNPVGVAGSGIPNTATVLVKTFYVGYPTFGSCLVPATFTINTSYTPTLTGSTRCTPGTSILTATGCTGGTVNWYEGISGGTIITTGTSFTTPTIAATTTYYADCTISTCVSERIPAIASIGTTDATYTSPQTAGNYQVNQSITSSANVATGVSYFAGKAILLIPGFQAGGDEVFVATIKECP